MNQKKTVDVIAVYSAGGEIRPLRLRMEDEERQPIRIDIEEIISIKDITYVGVEAQIFLCRATVWGREWLFELKYIFRSHIWWMLGRIH
ncbi:MAG: hypothetical protein IJB11_06580 [Oscillospiraceae bacterium]|nr:hypothetical protein [Oscillospiraceae bacterium]